MREFLHSFFNPPQVSKAKSNKKKVFKKRKKKTGPTPIQMQLDEAFEYLKYSLKQFEELSSGEERVMHVYREIPDEATTIDRYLLVLQKVPSEANPQVCNRGEGPY